MLFKRPSIWLWVTFAGVVLSAATSGPAAAQPRAESSPALISTPSTQPSDPLTDFMSLGQGLGDNTTGEKFLHPDVAFFLSAEVPESNVVSIRWTVANGYYLYRDKFKFALKDAQGVELGAVEIPPGRLKEDPYFGRVEVFYNRAQAKLALERGTPERAEVTLEVGYQGCAEAGLCYPPITKSLPLSLPPSLGTPRTSTR